MPLFDWLVSSGSGTFQELYANDLRANLFNGCITFAGFLLAAYTFIVIHMKMHVYDSPEYMTVFQKHVELNPKLTRYGPLRKLACYIMVAVVWNLVAGLLQVTLGLISLNVAALACVVLAVIGCIWVLYSIHLMTRNLARWFDSIEPAS